MTRLAWNSAGERYFEAGVDRGVLYTSGGKGVAWNGLVSVSETPSGGDITPYYIDGVKYANATDRKEFKGTLEAYTYPDEFAACDGWVELGNGLSVDEQGREIFSLSYRTLLGNDIDGTDYGYKIHILYNAKVSPTTSNYASLNASSEASTFSWAITTRPTRVMPHRNLVEGSKFLNLEHSSHLIIDSTKTVWLQMRIIEDYLYGREGLDPQLPSIADIYVMFEYPYSLMTLGEPDPVTGTVKMTDTTETTRKGDLLGQPGLGKYVSADTTGSPRLIETARPGIYTLEA